MRETTRLFKQPLLTMLRWSYFLILTLLLFGSTQPGQAAVPLAQGATIVVDSDLDVKQNNDGNCTLREAIIAANSDKKSGGKAGECIAGNGADTIMLDTGSYALSRSDNGNEDAAATGDLDISGDVTIVGHGKGETIIDASGISDRAFHILGGQVTLINVTVIKRGEALDGDGGGIYNSGTLRLVDSQVTGISVTGEGGGIYNTGLLEVTNSTISGNTGTNGAGIANTGSGSVTLNNSTISSNTGDGLYNAGILLLNNSTIAHNSGHGVVNNNDSGAVTVRNTILAYNSPANCSGALTSQGHNLYSDGSCPTGNGDLPNTDPLLGALQNNGGQAPTHALQPGSPAIDAADPDGCFGSDGLLAEDQRGQPRPADGNFDGSVRCDIGAFEAGGGRNGGLSLIRAFPDPNDNGDPTVHGLLDDGGNIPLTILDLKLFANTSCDFANPGQEVPYSIPADFQQTDVNGYFIVDNVAVSGQTFITAQATGPTGALLQSNCVPFNSDQTGGPNDAWPFSTELFGPSDVIDSDYIDSEGQSRWYKVKVNPNSNLTVILSGVGSPDEPLPADYDLTLYKDLQASFDEITDPAQEIVRLSAEYAGSSYSGSSYSGSSYSGSSYSGSSYSGSSYSGSSYSGSSYSGSSYSGSSYSGSSYSGSSYSGDAYIGSSYSGSSYSGSSYSGSSYSGSSYSEQIFGGSSYSEAYSDAQSRSLLAVSAIGGTAPERIFVRTWNSNEDYYVRVRSNNGDFSVDDPFRLEIQLEDNGCGQVQALSDFSGTPLAPGHDGTNPNPTTLIVYDSTRLDNIPGSGEIDVLAKLNQLAGATDGLLLDVNKDSRVQQANGQADNPDFVACPFAKNVVAQAIRDILDGYRTQPSSNLQYVVFVGDDTVIPFFRHPDNADLAQESQFVVPVRDETSSQAALRLNYILSQDSYIAETEVDLTNNLFPIVDKNVAAGRLVESATEISAVIDAFLSGGGVLQPQTSLVTGYDFLEDASLEVSSQLSAGIGNSTNELITPFDVPPTDPSAWTADQLRAALLSQRHDIIFLAGHFSGHSALAADYTTEMFAAEVAESAVDLQNSLIFSIGCHAGYNIVNDHEVPDIPRSPDWAQAFARKGATLVAGTGYQYGETLTEEYSERLYIEFSKQMRLETGGPVSIGHALNGAKLAYLTQIPQVRGLHEKVLLESTIFGLPMLKVDMPNRFTPPADTSVINALTNINSNPGATLGLQYADLEVIPSTSVEPVTLTDVTDPNNPTNLPAEFLLGSDGLVTFPTEPFLPLEIRNVTVPNTVLRGVGFRGGTYEDILNILPVTGAPTTEAIALHLSWQTDFLHPIQMWNSDYLGTLIDGQQRILFTPAQHIAGDEQNGVRKSHRRQFSDMDFRLYYSANFQDFDGHVPALSTPPSIIRVSSIPNEEAVLIRATVVGDPSAGMQSVWATWTDTSGPCPCTWQSIDLTQRETDTTMWEGLLPLNGKDPDNIRFIIQAVNGFGRTARAMNNGHFFTPGVDTAATVGTELTLDGANPTAGLFESQATFKATLTTADGQPLPNQAIDFRLGTTLNAQGITDGNGQAEVTINLLSIPDDMKLYAAFNGAAPYQSASDVADFTINKQQPQLIDLAATVVFDGQHTGPVATLVDEYGDPMRERGVFIIVTDPDAPNTPLLSIADITDLFGQVSLGAVSLPPGDYVATIYFNDPANPLVNLSNDSYQGVKATTGLTIYESPCQTATAILNDPDDPTITPETIWEPNGQFWRVDVVPNVPGVQITIDSVFQDEPVKSGADARFIEGDPDSVELSAERAGNGDGRVYHIFYTASGSNDFTCQGELLVGVVEHDQSGDFTGNLSDFDDGALYDSTIAPKDALIANDDQATTTEDGSVSGNVLSNDEPSKPNDVLTVSTINGTPLAEGSPLTLASGAVVTLNPDGAFSYDPTGQFENLADGDTAGDLFGYTVSDEAGQTASATVAITINGVNDAPVAVDDSASTKAETAVIITVLDNDTDVEGNALSVASVTPGINGGSVSIEPDSSVTYTPAAGFLGEDTFDYTAEDGNGGSATATVTVTVTSANDAPVATDDSASTAEDTAVTILVADNDTDVDGNLDPTGVSISGDPVNGTITNNGDGSITYTPATDFNGLDSFTYTIQDEAGLTSNEATVTITIDPVADDPVANDDSATLDTLTEAAVTINVVANDSDADGDLDPASVSVSSDPANGTATANGDGTITYTPTGDFIGTDSFTYEVCDATGACATATVTVTVNGNSPPDAVDDPDVTTTQGEAKVIPVLANDSDPDNDPLTVIEFSQGSRGSVTANADGTLTYTPGSNFKGTDSFIYTISDGRGGTATATVTVTTTK